MDVSNLIPSTGTSSPSQHATNRTQAPAEVLGAPHSPAPESAPTTSIARPTEAAFHAGDRVERSPELERRVSELRRELDAQPELSAERIEELRQEMREARETSHQTLVRAALGILRGELFFVASK